MEKLVFEESRSFGRKRRIDFGEEITLEEEIPKETSAVQIHNFQYVDSRNFLTNY